MKRLLSYTVFATGMALASFSATAATVADQLAAKYQLSERAFAENNTQVLLDQFYSDGVIMAGEGSDLVKGRDEMRRLLDGLLVTASKVEIKSHYADLGREQSDQVYDFVSYHVYPADGTDDFLVRSLLVWKKEARGWRVVADSYTFGNYR